MISPGFMIWMASIAILLLLLIALLEIHRSNMRREKEVMFGTELFNKKVLEMGLSPREIDVLEKIVRASKFENKDAVLNSALLFENSVSDYYEFQNVYNIPESMLNVITELRKKFDFTASNPLTSIYSTRQFNVGNRVDVTLDNGSMLKHSEILWINEKEWSLLYDGSFGPAASFIGRSIRVRWTRPEDAVYSTRLQIRSAKSGEFIVGHSDALEKQQLRRWIREVVNFPLEADFEDGSTCTGVLYDLSAGGILLGLPVECTCGQHIHIRFILPSFGPENVEVEILRNLGRRNPSYPQYFSQTASFTGAFGWIQERVLQYIFEVHKGKYNLENNPKMV